jgi:acyl-CoA reductase-like NAD-dependent aldehyde dehydrogenase
VPTCLQIRLACPREWCARLPAEHAVVFRRVSDLMETRHEEVVGWLIRESDSTRIKAELPKALRTLCALQTTQKFGLSSAVFMRDLRPGARFAQRLEAGMSHVNDQPVNDLPNNPSGGEKNSPGSAGSVASGQSRLSRRTNG